MRIAPFRFPSIAIVAAALSVALAPNLKSQAPAVAPAATDYAHITVLSTTDLHGHIFPVDYYTGKPDQTGLAKIATLIKQARKDAPRLLLLDIGDVIQGTPLEYYHNRIHNTPPDPMMLVMNTLGYDSMTPGNHEYNFGLAVMEKARHEANFPWISANTCRAGTNEPAFTPYIVKEIEGVRVGILGLTTPGVPGWEDKPNYAGLDFRDPITTAEHYVNLLREKERVDVVIVAMHMGLEIDLHAGLVTPGQQTQENTAIEIAESVPGIDLILMGHTHRDIPALVVNDVLIAQAGKWGDRLVRADLYLRKLPTISPNDEKATARWKVTARASRSIAVDERITADPDVLQLAQRYHDEAQAWLDKTIGKSPRELTATDSRLHDTAIVDLIQRVQLDAGRADISFAASFNPTTRIREGDITVRDIYSLYAYENTLAVVELSGADVKAALEQAALYYLPSENGSGVRESTTIPGYNCDMAEGVTYEIDPAQQPGERIRNLQWQGKPIDLAQKFRVAVNNYRLNGGGGYTMFKTAPVIWRSSTEIRDLIINWVETHGSVPDKPTNNWHIIGVN